MDKVQVEGLEVPTLVGVFDWEHEKPQPLIIDLEMTWSNAAAAASENLADALDYAAVSERVTTLIQARSWQLIETVAEQVAKLVLDEFGVAQVRVKVGKPQAVPQARTVAVEIIRSK